MFSRKELLALIISVLALAFVFGFDDGALSFVLENWLTNFFGIFLLVGISVLFREAIIKFFARRHETISEYRLWKIHRVWFKKELEKGIPFGILIAVILAVASAGKFFFTAIGMHNFSENKNARVGRRFQHLQYNEEVKIAAMGILSHLFLAVVAVLLGKILDFNSSIFFGINFYIVLFNMLPISELDGAKIFFGSLLTYIFLAVFIIISFLLVKFSVVLSLAIALLIAFIAMASYYWWSNR